MQTHRHRLTENLKLSMYAFVGIFDIDMSTLSIHPPTHPSTYKATCDLYM